MSTWLRATNNVAVREHWARLRIDKGIEVGWGTEELFDLAFRYFYQTFKYVHSITPETTYVMDIEDLDEPTRTENIMRQLCQRIGLDYQAGPKERRRSSVSLTMWCTPPQRKH